MVVCFHAPSDRYADVLVGSRIFSYGAAAAIVDADPDTDTTSTERPLFQLVSTAQTLIPDSDNAIVGRIREMGMQYYLSKGVPKFIGNNIVQCCIETFATFSISD